MTCVISLAVVVLISAALSRAEISIPLKICQEPVIAQCQCGMGGGLEDVYVKSCQVVSNDSRPCQPCPGACHVFQSCKTCSKYGCQSCPEGKNGTTCEVLELFQTTNPNRDAIQNFSNSPIENIGNVTFHDNTTDLEQVKKVTVDAKKANELVNLTLDIKQIKNPTYEHGSESNNTDIKLDSMVLVPKNFSGFQNDTGSSLNKTSQILIDFSSDSSVKISDIQEICTSSCSTVDTNEAIVHLSSQGQGSVVDENLHSDEVMNSSIEKDESIEVEQYKYKNDDHIEEAHEMAFLDNRNRAFSIVEDDIAYVNEDFLKHRSPNPSLDERAIAEKDETENVEQVETIDSQEIPISVNKESSLPKSDYNKAPETHYISVHTYEIPDDKDYPKDEIKEHISSNERDIKNDYADKTLEVASNQNLHEQISDFSQPHSFRQYLDDNNPHEQPLEILKSPGFSGNAFLFPETKPDSFYQNSQETNAEPRSEDRFDQNNEEFGPIHDTIQQIQSEIAKRKQPFNTKYYILEKNHNPLSLRRTDVNTNVNFDKAKFPAVIEHLLQLVEDPTISNQERLSPRVKNLITDEVSGDINPGNFKNSDAAPTNYEFLNLFPQASGPKSGAPNTNEEYSNQRQNLFKKYFSSDPSRSVVKGQIIVLQLENTNGTFSGLVPQLVRSRNFEFDIPLLKNNSDKKNTHNLKSEHKKHGKGSKHTRKLKRHRLNERGRKTCNPWKEDCTKNHNIGKGADSFKSNSGRKMKFADSTKIGRKGSNRPDRIHIKFMKMDNSPRTIATLKNNSSESSGLNDKANQSSPYENIMDHNSMGSKFSFSNSYPLERKLDDSPITDSNSSRILSRRKRSASHFCPIPKETRHGDLDCTIWSYKKSCRLVCHEGYTSSQQQFTCMRSHNTWSPPLTSCNGHSYNEPSNHVKSAEDDEEVDNGADYQDGGGSDNEEEVVKVEEDEGETGSNEESVEERVIAKKPLIKKHPIGKHVVKKPKKAHLNSLHMHEESHEKTHVVKTHGKGHPHPKGHAHPPAKPKHKGKTPHRVQQAIDESEDEEAAIASASGNEEEEEEAVPDQSTGDESQQDAEDDDAGEDTADDADYDDYERK